MSASASDVPPSRALRGGRGRPDAPRSGRGGLAVGRGTVGRGVRAQWARGACGGSGGVVEPEMHRRAWPDGHGRETHIPLELDATGGRLSLVGRTSSCSVRSGCVLATWRPKGEAPWGFPSQQQHLNPVQAGGAAPAARCAPPGGVPKAAEPCNVAASEQQCTCCGLRPPGRRGPPAGESCGGWFFAPGLVPRTCPDGH